MTRHKHADLIIAYANDASLAIQLRTIEGDWRDLPTDRAPAFYDYNEYRIKPKQAEKGDFICEINGVKWWLGPESKEEITWSDADKWCVEQGCLLPPREILLMCYLDENIRDQFKKELYWSGSENEHNLAGYAWVQGFSGGNQFNVSKRKTYYVRGVISSQ